MQSNCLLIGGEKLVLNKLVVIIYNIISRKRGRIIYVV